LRTSRKQLLNCYLNSMYAFSQTSKDKLATASKDYQTLANEVIKYRDCTVVTGHRTEEEQNKKFEEGTSKVQWPNSRHNSMPAEAIDLVPYPSLYEDEEVLIEFSGFVLGIAAMLKAEGKIENDITSGFQLWRWDHGHFQNK
jgi:peptidoglycan L-alanyl-D-glutamate endopeptidase CwlK